MPACLPPLTRHSHGAAPPRGMLFCRRRRAACSHLAREGVDGGVGCRGIRDAAATGGGASQGPSHELRSQPPTVSNRYNEHRGLQRIGFIVASVFDGVVDTAAECCSGAHAHRANVDLV
jgi:hypothetical protein